MMILSVVIGLGVGAAAGLIKNAVLLIQNLLIHGFSVDYQNYLYFAYPVIGIFIAIIFVRFIVKQHVGHGIPSVLYAISKDNGILKSHNLFSSIITSSFTVGFGGSVGLEGPTVATGAAVGSNLGQLLRLNYRQICYLMAFACAGAMSAIFKAPIAAVVFAVEVIMVDLTMASIVPLLISSATAAITSYFLLGPNVLYPFELKEKFIMSDIPYYLLLGVVAGLVSVYFTRMYITIGNIFEKIKKWQTRLIIGGFALGLIIFIFPVLYGEGYEAINMSLHGDYTELFNRSIFFNYKDNIVFVLVLMLFLLSYS